ncbi:hypothetical protein A4G19_03595 [Pasteurellaceae bacterium Macca]|nr:hypothetical protein [Pasteurellaceae bacterium Macca]
MEDLSLKTHYSVYELSDFKLSSLPTAPKNIADKAKRENWLSRKREGRGGGLEYSLTSLPIEVQTEIRKKCGLTLIEQKPKLDLVAVRDELDLRSVTDKQLAVADARAAVAQYFMQEREIRGVSRNEMINQLCHEIKTGDAPTQVLEWVRLANAKPRAVVSVSPRTLYQWVVDYEKASNSGERLKSLVPLKPMVRVTPETESAWLIPFLTHYQVFSKPSVEYVYRQLTKQGVVGLPTLSKVRRVLSQLPKIVLERGRRTGASFKAIAPFKRRAWDVMGVNEVWISDGHSFKARVKNMNGIPYVPEVTVFIDGRTRLIVGWSVAQSESVIAVSDAFRHAVSRHGLPVMCYSDNGRGQANKTLDAEITGLLPRLGVHHETGMPGNPQGRGIIERLWQQSLIDLAKTYPTYHGDDADESVKHYRYRKLESAIKALTKKKALTEEQQKHLGQVPHFADFIADLTACVEEYNQRPHRSLPQKNTGGHYSPAEYHAEVKLAEQYMPNLLDPLELQLLFRPEMVRTVSRGEVVLSRNIYFSTALAGFDGEQVRVGYDVHDPANVIVKTMKGEWICVAQLNGNRVDAFPKSIREQAEIKSVEAKNKRLQARIERNNLDLNPVITLEDLQPRTELITTTYRPKKETQRIRPIFTSQVEKDEWELEQQQIAVGG